MVKLKTFVYHSSDQIPSDFLVVISRLQRLDYFEFKYDRNDPSTLYSVLTALQKTKKVYIKIGLIVSLKNLMDTKALLKIDLL